MPECPRCRQKVEAQAIACPYCRNPLKAYGHPGIPLHQSTDDGYLCNTCIYHEDDTCNFPQRPYAKQCTLYQCESMSDVGIDYRPPGSTSFRLWLRRNSTLLLFLGLVVISVAIALRGL